MLNIIVQDSLKVYYTYHTVCDRKFVRNFKDVFWGHPVHTTSKMFSRDTLYMKLQGCYPGTPCTFEDVYFGTLCTWKVEYS